MMGAFRTHISLTASDVARSVQFYRHLLGVSPVKQKSDYAKFDSEALALNLSLVQDDRPQSFLPKMNPTRSHFGIQVEHPDDVREAIARFNTVGIETREELDTDCCYALQDKVWVSDPDGHRWEIFAVKNADTATANRCCEPACCR